MEFKVLLCYHSKAAYPINAMGMSKALMEKVAVAKGRELGEGAKTTNLLYTLWQCHGKSWFSYTIVGGTDDGRQTNYNNRPRYDSFHDNLG